MEAGSEGVLIGWFAFREREALVRFWDGGPLRVPPRLIEPVEARTPRAEQAGPGPGGDDQDSCSASL